VVELRKGLEALRADANSFSTVVIISLVTLFVGLLQTLFAPMVLHLTDSRTLGIIQSTSATGMVLCSMLVGTFGMPLRPGKTLSLGLLLGGGALSLMGASTNLVWISGAFFVFYFCLPLVNTGAEVSIRKAIPNEFQGRVWGTVGLLSQLGYISAYLFGGVVAEAVFEPLLLPGGALAATLGAFWGTGSGRGIALMLSLSGVGLISAGTVKAYSDSRRLAAHSTIGAYEP
jgi:hypothetical protein